LAWNSSRSVACRRTSRGSRRHDSAAHTSGPATRSLVPARAGRPPGSSRPALTSESNSATYTLTGPEATTHAQIAAALTAALGRTIRFIDIPPQAFADSIRGLLPPWQADGLLEDYAHYRRGEAAQVSPVIAEITGTAPRSIEQFTRDYAAAFADASSG
jgi:hypothetical protein